MIACADVLAIPLSSGSVDLVLGSPPYSDCRDYGIGADRNAEDWIDWMMAATLECCRVSRGAVLFVAANKGWNDYRPACEGLIYRWWKAGRKLIRPEIWTKNGTPGATCWEFVMGFYGNHAKPYYDGEALGEKLKYKAGGHFRQRNADGTRSRGSDYPTYTIRRKPPNFFYAPVGGGLLGSPLAHENEAPYPLAVAERYVKMCCHPGGLVLDPFSGSGTTAHAALANGRRFVACDIRPSQCQLTKRRLEGVQGELIQ